MALFRGLAEPFSRARGADIVLVHFLLSSRRAHAATARCARSATHTGDRRPTVYSTRVLHEGFDGRTFSSLALDTTAKSRPTHPSSRIRFRRERALFAILRGEHTIDVQLWRASLAHVVSLRGFLLAARSQRAVTRRSRGASATARALSASRRSSLLVQRFDCPRACTGWIIL